MSEFTKLQSVLANWPNVSVPTENWGDNSLDRLRRALKQMQLNQSSVGRGDLAGLIRHSLRRETIAHPDSRPALRVPRGDAWPDEHLWGDSDVDASPQGTDSWLIRSPRLWSSDWLHGSKQCPPLRASFSEERRRQAWPDAERLPLDPALVEGLGLEFDCYSCPGQRQAIQSAFFLQPGATLVINLPTGSGKSLVAWAPALMGSAGSLTLMVTPTVALAIDQERQLREQYPPQTVRHLPESIAWHSGLSDAEKKQIRRRLADGSQRIIIASPESVVTALARPLYEAAKTGQLKYFVVDEAHLVAQWGTEFRPEFQSMCGLRRELLESCPATPDRFRTLLLSATLSQESFDILRDLFAEELFDTVSAVALRPEPEYWMCEAKSEAARIARVRELVRVVPRPFILYVTKREHADQWTHRLRELEMRRVGCVHGATPTDMRSDVIEEWRQGDLDVVVATSAFGLGMDKSDVRTVIHACIPETVDRFYQEVGRGGRDGRACVSFLVHTNDDRGTARGLSSKKVITVEKGLERWKCMIDHASSDYSTGRLRLNLSQRPPEVRGDTEANKEWNLRTVVLLNRAGLIKIESDRPPEIQQDANETDEQFQSRLERVMADYAVTCPVRLLEESHLSGNVWSNRVEPVRQMLLQAGWASVAVMEDVLRGQREISEVLSEAYLLRGNDLHVDPLRVCGGCPACRANGKSVSPFAFPEPSSVRCADASVEDSLNRILGTTQQLVLVACSRSEPERSFQRKLVRFVLPKLVRLGVREIAMPEQYQTDRYCRELYRHSPQGFVIHRDICQMDERRTDLFVPRVSLFLTSSAEPIPEDLVNLDRPRHIIFAWDDVPNRSRSGLHFDRTPHSRFNDVLGRLNQ